MLVFHKIVDGEINDYDWPGIRLASCLGPILTIIFIIFGIGYLLIMIPYRLIFGKEKKK